MTDDTKTLILERLAAVRGREVRFADVADVNEAAAILRYEPKTVRNLISGKSPRLIKKKEGRATVIPLAEIERFMRFDALRVKYENPVR